MTLSTIGSSPMRFSTQWLPKRDRLDIWREEFSRRLVRLEIEPLNDEPLLYDTTYQLLGDVSIATGNVSAISCARTRKMLEDGNGDIVLLIPETTNIHTEQGRVDHTLTPGDCLVRRSSEVGRTRSKAGRFLTLNLPVERLTERVAEIDRLGMTILHANNEALQLLTAYCNAITQSGAALSPQAAHMSGQHLLDLASLAIGANRDAWLTARDRGLRAARRVVAQNAIRKNAANPGYRIGHLAEKMTVSESYLRKLLAAEGHSFSALLLEARLALAWEMLTDLRFAKRQISQIVFACGFGDISYFNRRFNQRFEMTPTDARKLAQRARVH